MDVAFAKFELYSQVYADHNVVRQECGSPNFDTPSTLPQPSTSAKRDALRAPPPYTELLQFAASLARNKKLFARVADRLCDEPDFENHGNDHCWNGEAVGEYTKPLVASASLNDQKYNPEVTGAREDSTIAALGDRLRQARQLLITYSKSVGSPAAEAFMQGDEAGEEGSGSGRNYDSDDTYDDEDGSGEEGSGTGAAGTRTINEETPRIQVPKTSAATTTQPVVTISIGILAVFKYCLT
ncbi:hypothetical protein ACJJTC_011209 [Scirpophaga incertulas]